MRLANRAFGAAGACFAMAVLAGCGSNGTLLSAGQAGALTGQLNRISEELSAGNCQEAASQIQSFQNAVSGLGSVNQTLVSNLDQGASTIATLAQRRCPTGAGPSTTATTPTKTTKTKTKTTTTSTQTTTTPTTSSTTTTTPTTTSTVPTLTGTTTTPATTTTGTSTTGGAGIGSGG